MAVDDLRDAVGRACGARVTAVVAVGGGDVGRAGRFVLDDGRSVFAKSVAGHPGLLAAEAAGLAWLREGLAAGLGLGPGLRDDEAWPVQVPEVLAVVDDDVDPLDGDALPNRRPSVPVTPLTPSGPGGDGLRLLVLAWVPTSRAPVDGERLGRGLAALHRATTEGFGLGRTTWCGPLPQDNRPSSDWASFYGERRLRPLARLAAEAGHLDPATVALVDRVVERLPELVGPDEPPSRLHGDLWSGNVVAGADGRPWLVDAAAHAGHREVDLAMLRLFGGVDERTYAAYEEAHPLAEGAAERVRLWQLAPLLVHAALFGGGYPSAVRSAARAYL